MPGKNWDVHCPGCGRRAKWSERRGRDRIVCPRCKMVFEDKPVALKGVYSTSGRGVQRRHGVES